ncbi:MAG: metallophosphoesterase [Pseudomonadota bacterium]
MSSIGAPLRVLQVTDTHLFPDANSRLVGVDTRATLAATLDAALSKGAPDLLLLTGDLAEDPQTEAYAALEAIVQQRFSGDLLCVPGNHDDPARSGLFERREWFAGDWGVLGLDSRVANAEGGRVAEAELRRLLERIDAAQQPNLLIAVHHPPLELASPLDHGRIENGRELLAELGARGAVRAILFGHVHQAVEAQIGTLRLFGTPSSCVQFKPLRTRFALDLDSPSSTPGWRWLTLGSDGSFASEVQRLDAAALGPEFRPVIGSATS